LVIPAKADSDHVLIRPATAEDIPAILAMAGQAEQAAHWPEEKYRQMLVEDEAPRRLVLVLEDQGTVQGFALGQVLHQECQIETLVIASGARRKGLATKLLQRLIQAARHEGVNAFFLEARESNLGARALYNKIGFAESGRRKRYYREPEEDGVLYCFLVPFVE
jgi:ribosomal-protein-alanine N-acetyltransferase